MGTIWKVDQNEFIIACEELPKYRALARLIEQAITSNELVDGQKLPAQRYLADQLSVTHGTVTRAYEVLEKKGVVVAKLGAGTFVNTVLLSNDIEPLPREQCYDFASSMQPMLGQQNIVATAMQTLAQSPEQVAAMMSYSVESIERHQLVMSHWLAGKGINNDADDIVFTQGAQQAIYTCLQILTEPGEIVLHEALTYPGFFQAAQASRLHMLPLPFKGQGLDLAYLEEQCIKQRPKLLYITPNCQNPTNLQYSSQQRQKLLQLSATYQFYIIEDDVNYCLPERWSLPMQQQAPERVFYLSSLSKYVSGGLRVGYALVPKPWQAAFKKSLHSQCWMNSTLNIELASRFLATSAFEENQQRLAEEMRYRQRVFSEALDRHGLSYRLGGLNIWLTLPYEINMHQFNGLLATHNMKVRPADLFCHNALNLLGFNGFRLSLGGFDKRDDFLKAVELFEVLLIQFKNRQDIVI